MTESANLIENLNLNKPLYSKTLIYTVAITVLGGSFQFGYQLGALNQPQAKIIKFIETNLKERYHFEITKFSVVFCWSVAVSAFCVGGMIGGLSGCQIAYKFGRRKCLILAALISILGESTQGATLVLNSYFALVIGRFVTGIGCGIFSAVVPLYINEISPPCKRGFFGSFNQVMITVGIVISQTLGLESILGTTNLWPVLLAFSSTTAILLVIILPFCPPSPYYLVFGKNDKDGAINSLKRLLCNDNVDDEIIEICEEKTLVNVSKATFMDLLVDKNARKSLGVALALHISQQFSGINSVIFYSTSIFLMAGVSRMTASIATISLGLVQLVTSIVAGPFIDRLGRRFIFLTSLTGCTISIICLTICLLYKIVWGFFSYVAIVVVIVYVACFGVGLGIIPWLMTPELFSPNYRDLGIGIAILSNWIANAAVANLYPIMQNKLGVYSFVPFILFSSLFIIIIYKYCPETTNLKNY